MNIEELISQYIDGALSSEQEAELHHRLSVSTEDRRLFRQHMALQRLAGDRRMLQQPSPQLREELFARLKNEPRTMPPATDASLAAIGSAVPMAAAAEPVGSYDRTRRAADAPPARRNSRRRAAAVLLPFVVGIIAMALIWEVFDTNRAPEVAVQSRSADADAGPAVAQAPELPETATTVEQSVGTEPSTGLAGARSPSKAPETSARHRSMADAATRFGSGGSSGSSERRSIGAVVVAPHRTTASDVESLGDAALAEESSERAFEQSSGQPMRSAVEQMPAEQQSMSSAAQGLAIWSNPDGADDERQTAAAPPPPSTLSRSAKSSIDTRSMSVAPTQQQQDGGASNEVSATERLAAPYQTADSAYAAAEPLLAGPLRQATPGGHPTSLLAGFQQSIAVDMGGGMVTPEFGVRVGGEFAGAHQLYAIVGRGGYRQATTVQSVEINQMLIPQIDTTVVNLTEMTFDTTYVERTEATLQTESSVDSRAEVWGGVGYRISVDLGRRFSAGGGVWVGAGTEHVRVGAEFPVSFNINSRLRVEALPMLQYRRVISAGVETTTEARSPSPRSSLTREVTSGIEAPSELSTGIGIGIMVTIQ